MKVLLQTHLHYNKMIKYQILHPILMENNNPHKNKQILIKTHQF